MLIFWDIDGTLMHCGADGTKALNKTFADRFGVDDAFSQAGIGSAMDAVLLARIVEKFQLKDVDMDAIRTEYVSNLEQILAADAEKRILPGVVPLLDYVREKPGWENLLLTSNLQKGAEAKLRAVSLLDYFPGPVKGGFGDAVGEKWDAAARALAALGYPPRGAASRGALCVVGDSVYDIRCARQIGAAAVAVATGWTSKEVLRADAPDFLLDDLSDRARVVDILNAAAV
jgi:phosphoglycolate phosphatase-like HAD superfamily hydrolase